MNVEPAVKKLIESRGLRQNWVVDRMNNAIPELNMSTVKFSAIVCGGRRMTGDELIAFCLATETSPDYFCNVARGAQDSV